MKDRHEHGVVEFLVPLVRDLIEILEVGIMLTQKTKDTLLNHTEELLRRVKQRGLHSLMVELPKLGKLYDKGVSSGFLDTIEVSRLNGLKLKDKEFGYLFEPLILLSFRNGGTFIEGTEASTVRATRSLLYAFKKVQMDSPVSVIRRSHHDFFDLDDTLRRPDLCWDVENPNLQVFSPVARNLSFASFATGKQEERLLTLLDGVRYYLCPQRTFEVTDVMGRHGPGAVADLNGGSDKYVFPNWPARLSTVFPPGYMISSWGESEREYDSHWGSEVPAKLIAVPKTIDKPRLIASEPTANMWCQQAILGWIRKNPSLGSLFVDFHSQSHSRELALRASQDGSLATIDLSSASDRLSCWTVERMFKSNPTLIAALMASRSRSVTSELVGKTLISMRKYAPQGNATTFPVQSLVYAAAAIAATLADKGLSADAENIRGLVDRVRVFGDDIILPKTAVLNLSVILSALQLKINSDKTHYMGNFRESCGMDAYCGVDVTPLYLSSPSGRPTTPSTVASWCAVHNNAVQKGFHHIASSLRDAIPEKYRKVIPISNKPQPGVWLLDPDGSCPRPAYRSRYNEELQREEQQVLRPITKGEREDREDYSNLLQWFTEGRAGCPLWTGKSGVWTICEGSSVVGYFSSSVRAVARTWVSLNN